MEKFLFVKLEKKRKEGRECVGCYPVTARKKKRKAVRKEGFFCSRSHDHGARQRPNLANPGFLFFTPIFFYSQWRFFRWPESLISWTPSSTVNHLPWPPEMALRSITSIIPSQWCHARFFWDHDLFLCQLGALRLVGNGEGVIGRAWVSRKLLAECPGIRDWIPRPCPLIPRRSAHQTWAKIPLECFLGRNFVEHFPSLNV